MARHLAMSGHSSFFILRSSLHTDRHPDRPQPAGALGAGGALLGQLADADVEGAEVDAAGDERAAVEVGGVAAPEAEEEEALLHANARLLLPASAETSLGELLLVGDGQVRAVPAREGRAEARHG